MDPKDVRSVQVLKDALDMRERISEAKAALLDDQWALKHVRGGLVDIEFIAQAGALVNGLSGPTDTVGKLRKLGEIGWLSAKDAADLSDAFLLQATAQQTARVATGDMIDPEAASPGLRKTLTDATGSESFEGLIGRLADAQALVRDRFRAIIG